MVKFLDLNLQYKKIKPETDRAVGRVLSRCDFILGQDVISFEREFARYCGCNFAIGINSGTDALFLGLLSIGVGRGDEVIVPAFTYIATAFAVTYSGAKPVFVDIDEETFNIDTKKIGRAITKKTKAIIPVHLFGQCADMKPILDTAKKYNLKIIEDAAQAHGATYMMRDTQYGIRNTKKAGSMGDIGAFSFYPTKNMGGFGDGGIIVTDSRPIFEKLFKLRDYGRRSKYEHVTIGYNSRLDSLQAAILRVKLKHLNEWNRLRRRNASLYNNELKGIKGVILPREACYARHVYHAYTVRTTKRKMIIDGFRRRNIGSMIYYPIPLHLQEVYAGLGHRKGDFVVAERLAGEVISLPMYPYLREGQIKYIARSIKESLK